MEPTVAAGASTGNQRKEASFDRRSAGRFGGYEFVDGSLTRPVVNSNQGGDREMISLAGGPMGPLHSGVAASGDWTTVAVLVVFIAIALAAIAVIDYRTYRKAKPQPSRERE